MSQPRSRLISKLARPFRIAHNQTDRDKKTKKDPLYIGLKDRFFLSLSSNWHLKQIIMQHGFGHAAAVKGRPVDWTRQTDLICIYAISRNDKKGRDKGRETTKKWSGEGVNAHTHTYTHTHYTHTHTPHTHSHTQHTL